MEAAGLAIGAVGLLGLYNLFRDAVSKVQSIKHFPSESHRLTSRYNATKILLERWGKDIGIASKGALEKSVHPELKEPTTASTVAGLLKAVHDIFTDVEPLLNRYEEPSLPGKVCADSTRMKTRLKWAFADSGKLARQVQEFDDIVHKIYRLVPPERLQQDEFQLLQERLIDSIRNEALERVLRWLDATTTENSYDAHCSARLDSTCGWISGHPTFMDWLSDTSPNLSKVLWVHGPAGFGKSVLCAYIVKMLRDSGRSAVYYFFCSGEIEAQRKPDSIIRSWVHQAARSDESALEIILQYMESCEGIKATQSDLWRLLREISTHRPDAVYIVDGFDECPRTSTARVDMHRSREDFLNKLSDEIRGTETRLLVLSRDEGDIASQLRPDPNNPPDGVRFHELAVTKDHVSSDVALFANYVVTQKLTGRSTEFKQDIANQMAGKSAGMFLWVRLQSHNLRPHKGKAQLQRMINETPTDLIHVYERGWRGIQNYDTSDRHRAEAILRWVTFARRPLSIAELAEITAVMDDNNNDPQFDEFPDPFNMAYVDSEILGLCGSFLEIRADDENAELQSHTVHLVHFTAKEFLSDVQCNAPFSEKMLQHLHLTQLCLRYLDNEDTWQPPEEDVSTGALHRPFLAYVVHGWYYHLDGCIAYRSRLQPQLRAFFGEENKNWDSWRQLYESGQADAGGDSDTRDLGADTSSSNDSDPSDSDTRPVVDASKHQDFRPGSRIYYAAVFGLDDVMKYLFAKGVVGVDTVGGCAGRPLFAAAALGHIEALKFLLEMGADIHASGRYGTALQGAATANQVEAIKLLLQHGARVTDIGVVEGTPLLLAVYKGCYEAAQFLISMGSDLSVAEKNGLTPLHMAAWTGDFDMAELLLRNGADVALKTDSWIPPLCISAWKGHARIAKMFLDAGADLTESDNEGETPLFYAAWEGHIEVVNLLLNSGADPTVAGKEGGTPLHVAANEGHVEIVRALLNSGADLAAFTSSGQSPLHQAALGGQVETVQLLLDTGADVSVADIYGYTPLHSTAFRGHVEVLELLLKAEADVSAANGNGMTPLHLAAGKGHVKVLELLLKAGASFDAQMLNGFTPLHVAFRSGHKDIIHALVAAGAPCDCFDMYGLLPFQHGSVDEDILCLFKDQAIPESRERQQLIKSSVHKLVDSVSPSQEKNTWLLNVLGTCLLLLNDTLAASLVFSQAVESITVDGEPIHSAVCDKCDDTISGKRYTCSQCVPAGRNLCSSCMERYKRKNGFRRCHGHEFHCVPSPDWRADQFTDVYTEEFVEWLRQLSFRYKMSSL